MEEYVVAAVSDSLERNHQERLRLEGLRDTSNPFHLPEEKFRKLFRLPRSGAINLISRLNDPKLTEGRIPKHIKILNALHFFAQGSYQAAVGQDSFLSLSQPSVSRCLDATVAAINNELMPLEIKFPTSIFEKEATKLEFLELYNMPNTLGAVDGTHFSITRPPTSHPTAPGNLFYNRKGYYSINCQIVCDAKGKILSLNPNFPGSTHDAAIWRTSRIYEFLKNEYLRGQGEQWLLGDKAYPLQPWLMTPIEATSNADTAYNDCHIRARNVVEMSIGRLKNKFRCLHRHRCLHYEPEKAADYFIMLYTLLYVSTFF